MNGDVYYPKEFEAKVRQKLYTKPHTRRAVRNIIERIANTLNLDELDLYAISKTVLMYLQHTYKKYDYTNIDEDVVKLIIADLYPIKDGKVLV